MNRPDNLQQHIDCRSRDHRSGGGVILAAAQPSSMIHRLPKAQPWSLTEGVIWSHSGAIFFNGTSTGGTARVEVFRGYPSREPNGYLDIGGHQSGVTVGSIEGDGDVFLGANDLTVGTNNLNTTFSGCHRRQRFAGQGRQWGTHFANQLLHRGHRRSHSGKRLDYQARLYRRSGRNRIFSGRRRFATAGYIWRSNERRSAYPS